VIRGWFLPAPFLNLVTLSLPMRDNKTKLMRKIFTLLNLCITTVCLSQVITTAKVITLNNLSPATIDSSVNLQKGLTGKVTGLNVQTVNKGSGGARITLRCRRTNFPNEAPLLIIDGVVQELSILQAINPGAIKNIDILKSAAATALYGPEGVYGAIYVTTKNGNFRTFVIKDFLDGSKIAGATVSFISADKKDTLMYATNDSGIVVTDKLRPVAQYEMSISAVGYKSVCQDIKNGYSYKEQAILLSREFKCFEEVIIYGSPGIRCGRCFGICRGITRCRINQDTLLTEKISTKTSVPKIFPNPVQKAGLINIVIENSKEERLMVKILALDGRLMLDKSVEGLKGSGRFQLTTDARWTAGVYIIQLAYANGKILASEKVIIQ